MEADSTFDNTLEDNTVEGVKRAIKCSGIEKAIDQADDLFKNCKLDGSTIIYNDSEEEEIVEEGHIQGNPEGCSLQADNMAGDEVDFEVENGVDGDKAIEYSRTLKVDFIPSNVEFWFTNLENEMFYGPLLL